MGNVVAGIGTSHSPALNMTPPAWRVRAEVLDKTKVPLFDPLGKRVTYEEALANADPAIANEITDEVLDRRHASNQRAIAAITQILHDCKPDVMVIIGDDHHEVFKEDNLPSLAICCGESVPFLPTGILKWPYQPELKTDLWYPEQRVEYPVATDLASHIVGSLTENNFDVACSRYHADGVGMSHAFAFPYWRLMQERIIPTIPVYLNTYFPPNQMSPQRCYNVGRGIKEAVESWDADTRVAVVATGGLSHFLIDEELDQEFITALQSRGQESITGLPVEKLNGGTSELRNWIALAGAVEHLDTMKLVDYVPCYRSLAGTGCAMTFAHWH